jgi:hypothetical protein
VAVEARDEQLTNLTAKRGRRHGLKFYQANGSGASAV